MKLSKIMIIEDDPVDTGRITNFIEWKWIYNAWSKEFFCCDRTDSG